MKVSTVSIKIMHTLFIYIILEGLLLIEANKSQNTYVNIRYDTKTSLASLPNQNINPKIKRITNSFRVILNNISKDAKELKIKQRFLKIKAKKEKEIATYLKHYINRIEKTSIMNDFLTLRF